MLFGWRLQLVEVELELPEIQLTREENRRLELLFDQRIAAVQLGEAAGGGGLGTLLGESGEVTDPRFDDLRLVRVSAPSLQFVDAVTGDRATAADAVFELEKDGAIWRASLKGQLGNGTVAVVGEPTATPGRPDVSLRVDGLRPKDFVAFAPTVPLAGLDLPVSGTVRFSLDAATASVGAAKVDLTMGAGAIAVTTLGLAPIAIKEGQLRGEVAAGWSRVEVERLQLVAEEFTLGAAGKLAVSDGAVTADVAMDATELDVAEVLQLWPTAGGRGRARLDPGQHRRGPALESHLPDRRARRSIPTSPSSAAASPSRARRSATSIPSRRPRASPVRQHSPATAWPSS